LRKIDKKYIKEVNEQIEKDSFYIWVIINIKEKK